MDARWPCFGASPDGITNEAVFEVKCPAKESTVCNYYSDGVIKPKFKAQVHLQMLLAKKKLAFFCVADPSFEKNKIVTILEISFDEKYIMTLVQEALKFWRKGIFSSLMLR